MSFYDRVTLSLRAGRGGDGSAYMRREAHVPRGGVDGGDGGHGGDIILIADASRRDLAHLRRTRSYSAENGTPGTRKRQSGKRGDDRILAVPIGTQAFTEDGRKLCDLTAVDATAVIARGGVGGWGNTHFATPTRRAPMFAEIGLPGEELEVELRLKLMADAALVGKPNAGKSSLLARISNARPKVGDYPFTTLAPVLGTIERPDGSQLVVMDVPGLLEGASEGHGMGNDFLPHFERAHILLHTITLESPERIVEDFAVIVDELWAYDPRIAQLPQIVVLTKRDLVDDEAIAAATVEIERAAERTEARRGPILAVHALSSATRQGLTPFVQTLFQASAEIDRMHAPAGAPIPASVHMDDYRVYKPVSKRRRWRIYREKEGFRISGDSAMRVLADQARSDSDAFDKLHEILEGTGALKALQMAGAKDGVTVDVCGYEFELWW